MTLRGLQLEIQYFLCVLLALTLPLSVSVNSLIILLLFINWIVFTAFKKESFSAHPTVFLFLVLFTVYFLRVVVLDDFILESLKKLEKYLSLFVIPVSIAFLPGFLTKSKLSKILFAFIFSTFVICILSFRNGIDILLVGNNNARLIEFSKVSLIHRPYLGMYCAFAAFCAAYLFNSSKNKIAKFLYVVSILFFILYTYLIFAKMTIVSLIIIGIFILLLILYHGKKKKLLATTSVLLVIGIATLINNNERIQDYTLKILQFKDLSFKNYDKAIASSINARYRIWNCSVDLLKKDNNWIMGAGPGAYQDKLNECYNERKWTWHVANRFNPHNQFLQSWLDVGLLGLLLFIGILTTSFYHAVIRRKYLWLSFIILFALSCLPESMLAAQKGIVFFAFFNSLFTLTIEQPDE